MLTCCLKFASLCKKVKTWVVSDHTWCRLVDLASEPLYVLVSGSGRLMSWLVSTLNLDGFRPGRRDGRTTRRHRRNQGPTLHPMCHLTPDELTP